MGLSIIGSVIGVSTVCCVHGFVLAAIFGAIGGVIYAAVKPEWQPFASGSMWPD